MNIIEIPKYFKFLDRDLTKTKWPKWKRVLKCSFLAKGMIDQDAENKVDKDFSSSTEIWVIPIF